MRELRYVGPGADAEHVLVASEDRTDQFTLVVDTALRSAVTNDAGPASATSSAAARATVTVSPREIQTRVRAGADPAQVAAEVGVPVERVLVFATPVLEERNRVTGEARRARARRSSGVANGETGQLVEFGEAVDRRYAAHGIDPAAVGWDAYRRDDGAWVISATWRGGDADRTAQWAFALPTRTVSALDETAADLLSDRPIRAVVRAVPAPAAPAEETTHIVQPAGPDAGSGAEPSPATVNPADAESNTAPLPALAPAAQADRAVHDGGDTPLPLRLAEPVRTVASARPTETEDQRAARARIPSWDDIMLGVRRKRD